MVTCIFSFFFNLVENNLLLAEKLFSVAKMASTVYETGNHPGAISELSLLLQLVLA